MNAKLRYQVTCWKPRALSVARTLKGHESAPVMNRIKQLDTFSFCHVYGCQPESQAFIDSTISLIESLDQNDRAAYKKARKHLKWSVMTLR